MPNPVIEERHYHSEREDTTVLSTILALIAVLLIVGFALYVFRVYPFNAAGTAPSTTNQYDVNVNTPDLTPSGAVTAPGGTTTNVNPSQP